MPNRPFEKSSHLRCERWYWYVLSGTANSFSREYFDQVHHVRHCFISKMVADPKKDLKLSLTPLLPQALRSLRLSHFRDTPFFWNVKALSVIPLTLNCQTPFVLWSSAYRAFMPIFCRKNFWIWVKNLFAITSLDFFKFPFFLPFLITGKFWISFILLKMLVTLLLVWRRRSFSVVPLFAGATYFQDYPILFAGSSFFRYSGYMCFVRIFSCSLSLFHFFEVWALSFLGSLLPR